MTKLIAGIGAFVYMFINSFMVTCIVALAIYGAYCLVVNAIRKEKGKK